MTKEERTEKLETVFTQCDVDDSGSLNVREFRELGGDGPASMIEAVFKRADKNSDGKLTRKEFIKYNLLQGEKLSDAEFIAMADRSPSPY